jgi:hypothetical protein
MDSVEIYDRKTIHRLDWPATEEGRLAQQHLLPLITEGPETFIQNALTCLKILKFGDLLIPFTVNEAEYQNCYLLSSYFVAAGLKEKNEKSQTWRAYLIKPLITLLSGVLKWIKINKVVIINNWLLTTNPYPSNLTAHQIHTITAYLRTLYPDHYLMFRSVNTYKDNHVYHALLEEQFRLIPCRQVYMYDPNLSASLPSNVLRKQKKDANRLTNRHYSVEQVTTLLPREITRLLELYKNVYIKKYTSYSPCYTEKYLLTALKNQTFRLKVLKKEGIIYGVAGFLEKNGYLLVPFFGYDTAVSQEEGLYRMLSAIIMQEIHTLQLISHQGSGAGQFKKWRGFFEQPEYVGIYDRHLPYTRRLFWMMSQKYSSRFLDHPTTYENGAEENDI